MAAMSYGERVALSYARRNAERRANAKPPKKRNSSAEPIIEWTPMDGYEYRHTQDGINWETASLTEIAGELSSRLSEDSAPNMQMLVLQTGGGKTAAAVATLGKLAQGIDGFAFIVVAPKAVIEGKGWQETICSYNIHNGAFLTPLLLTTYEKLANILAHTKARLRLIKELPKNTVLVLDEVHAYKNPTSKRSKQLQKLSRFKRLGLTATPLTNDIVMDSASYLIMGGYYRNKTDFMNSEGLVEYLDRFNRLIVYDVDGRVDENIWPNYVRVKERMAEILYQPTVTNIDDEMPNVRETVIQLPPSDALASDMASLASAYRKRLFASAAELSTAMFERVCADSDRVAKCVEICADPTIRQPLVFFWHKATLAALEEAFSKAGLSYQIIDGEHRMADVDKSLNCPILIQYEAGSEGIEFKSSNASVFYENQYSYIALKQARGRNVRRGMDGEVDHFMLVSPTMFDQEVFSRVMNKEEINEETLSELAVASLPSQGSW